MPAPPARPGRIPALDVLRGFALCGILMVNVRPIADQGGPQPRTTPPPADVPGLSLLLDQRFFPIFALLFGVGFALLVESAAGRTDRPRLVLLRRLLALLVIGLLHRFLLWPGDVLTVYAVVGLVVLLPSTWLPRWAVAGLAAVALVVPLVFSAGGATPVPGLFLLGAALVRYGVVARIERSTRVPLLLGLLLAAAATPALWLQAGSDGSDSGRAMAVAGLLLAGVYVCTLLVLLRTPLRGALTTVFAPLGRTALTNYLTATLLVLAAAQVIGGAADWPPATVYGLAAAVLVLQWGWSTLWLRRHPQGPFELLWRRVTWWQRPPPRRGHPVTL